MNKPVVLVIRQADDFSSILKQNGFEVLNLPLISTEPVEDLNEFDEKLRTLNQYDGLFITSPTAAEIFIREAGDEARRFPGKVYVLGDRTKFCFANTNYKVVFSQRANTAEEFIRSFKEEEFLGKKFLFVRGDKSMRTISALLQNSAVVDEIVVYRTIENQLDNKTSRAIREKLDLGEIDWICFFSPSGIDNYIKLFISEDAIAIKTAVIGDTTAKRASEAGFNVQLISPRASARDFAMALAEHITNIE
ncbi:MAG: uroporphyrinogen-III synthase [Acidobacteriota bacterium]|nr:uroporphyrinogen-III synthase [Acidobacteriota bacterium]